MSGFVTSPSTSPRTAMAYPIFFLLPLSLFLTASSAAATRSSSHCPTYDCGNGVSISYPFWVSDNTTSSQFCGYRDFGLTCSDSAEPVLTLPTDSYYVKNISYDDYTLTLVDIDIVSQTCPRARHNLTLVDAIPLSVSSLDSTLAFYFNCTSAPDDIDDIGCLVSGAMGSYVFLVGEEPEGFDWWDKCEQKVMATVMQAEIAGGNLSGGYGGAMKKGFVLDWRSAMNCGECEARGGLCGYSNAKKVDLCFCEDGSISRTNCGGRGFWEPIILGSVKPIR